MDVYAFIRVIQLTKLYIFLMMFKVLHMFVFEFCKKYKYKNVVRLLESDIIKGSIDIMFIVSWFVLFEYWFLDINMIMNINDIDYITRFLCSYNLMVR